MWQCPNCNERLQDGFNICWKCGTDAAGNRDPGFCISEPVRERDQALDSPVDHTQLPSLRLPTITYFSIPPFVWISLVLMPGDRDRLAANPAPDFWLSPIEIVFGGIAIVFIVVPGFFVMNRALFLCIIRRQNPSNSWADVRWILSMYRLPNSIRRSQPWFVPVYYASIWAALIAPIGFLAWRLIKLA